MAQRRYRGELGRPFGTLAALMCLILLVAQAILSRISFKITGAAFAADTGSAKLDTLQDFWGLLLAGEIVRTVAGAAVILAAWTIARPAGSPIFGRWVQIALGTTAGAALIFAGRQGCYAAAHFSNGEIVPHIDLFATLVTGAFVLLAAWSLLVAAEARRADTLPGLVIASGVAFAGSAIVAALVPAWTIAVAWTGFVWFGGLFASLRKPEDRILA